MFLFGSFSKHFSCTFSFFCKSTTCVRDYMHSFVIAWTMTRNRIVSDSSVYMNIWHRFVTCGARSFVKVKILVGFCFRALYCINIHAGSLRTLKRFLKTFWTIVDRNITLKCIPYHAERSKSISFSVLVKEEDSVIICPFSRYREHLNQFRFKFRLILSLSWWWVS